nr:unnamed protein product [Leishmania braziliensis]
MSSDAELDAKLTELLRLMVSRLPSNKTLPTAIVQQLLRAKYGDTYPEAYVASHLTFISDTIMKLMIEKEKAAAGVTANGGASEEEDEDDSSTSDEDDSDEGDSEEDEEEDGVSGSDDDDDFDSDEDDDDEDDDDDDDDGDNTEEPKRKKTREEVVEGIAVKEQQGPSDPSSATSVAERCKAMAECLRKLSYRVRGPTAEESLEEYLQKFLSAEFEKHGMDPNKYSKSDIKRYRIQREVELLQQDGASLSLDRRNRAGRGFGDVTLSKEAGGSVTRATPSSAAASARKTSMFLDD